MAKTIPLLLIVAAVGVIAFLLITSTAPFSGKFNNLYPRKESFASLLPPPDCSSQGLPSLQSQIDNTQSGGTLTLSNNCVYRESVSISKAITIDGGNQAQIRGSDVWNSWSQSGSTWVSAQTVPNFPIANLDPASYLVDVFQGSHPEQVFVDGSELTQVPGSPAGNQFILDGSRHIVLGMNPAGHTIEVTIRRYWVSNNADNVTIKNITMRHAASAPQIVSAITNNERSNFTLQDSVLSDAHGSIMSINGGGNTKILRNDISYGHELGISSGNGSAGNVVQGNKVYNSGDWYDWQGALGTSGGIKLTQQTNTLIDNNETWGNHGPGIWCDINCNGPVTMSNNRSHDNSGPGLMFEISNGAKIFGNKVWKNADAGIYISTSNGAEVYNNISAWNYWGIRVGLWNRGDAPSGCCTNNFVHDNTMYESTGNGEVFYFADAYGDLAAQGNHGSANKFWSASGGDGSNLFFFGQQYQTLGSFNGTSGGGGNSSYISDTITLTQNGMPSCPTCALPTPAPSTTPGVESPFNGVHNLPGTLQAEDYDNGGPEVAYHDIDPGNNGGAYRSQDVDIKATSDTGGGNAVGWIQSGEWMKYAVSVPTAGSYIIGARICTAYSDGQTRTLSMSVDGVTVGTFTPPVTAAGANGDFCTFQTVNLASPIVGPGVGINLSAGSHILTLTSIGADFFDFNYLTITSTSTPSPTPSATPSGGCTRYVLGDTDCNGAINIFDYNTIVSNFGKTVTAFNNGDLDGNGTVNIFDYNSIVTNFGK
jgi:hypothetical protein